MQFQRPTNTWAENGGRADKSVWEPGRLDRARALVRRILVAILGRRGEAIAHSTYHRLLRAVGRFGPPEDASTTAVLRAVASRSRTIIDVGANVGRYAWFLSQQAGRGTTVIALEPHPGAARLLRDAVGGIPGCMVLELAAADVEGTATLHVPPGAFGSAVPALSWVESARQGDPEAGPEVRLRRLDGLIEDGTITVVGPVFVKIDVEGYEAGVLRGAAELLRRFRPVIYFECQAAMLARQGETPEAVWRELGRAGYRIFGNRAGGFREMGSVEPDVVNYLGMPDVGATDMSSPMDAANLGEVLDAWAAVTSVH